VVKADVLLRRAALHGADGDLQDLGGVGVGDPVQVAQHHRDPELLRHLGEGGLDRDGGGDRLTEVHTGIGRQPGVLGVQGRQPDTAPAPGLVGGGVDGDAVEPGGEGGGPAEGRGLAEGGQERLLGGVLGILAVAEDAQAEAVDAALVTGDQDAEGAGVASQVGGEEGFVARVAHEVRETLVTPPRYLPSLSWGRLENQISR
jgi:hypothetical protein